MDFSMVRIQLEENLGNELFALFEGDIVDKIIKESKVEEEKNYLKSILEGHSFKITKNMASHIYNLCKNVQDSLEFSEEIDFYITNSPQVNCSTYQRIKNDQSHMIMINSGLLEKFDDDELSFVIGHEIGHLISKNTNLFELINFIFPVADKVPLIFHNKITLWRKLSELTADRYGFIASPKLDKAISNFFKLSAGIDTSRIDFDPKGYIIEIEKALAFFQQEPFAFHSSHPVNPVRVKAIQLFSESELYKQIKYNSKMEPDVSLEEQIDELIQILTVVGSSELDIHRSYFIASGGLVVSGVDEGINLKEVTEIVNTLSGFTMFPKRFIDSLIETEKVNEIFHQSVEAILNQNPGEKYEMLKYLTGVALSDNEISKREIDLLYDISKNMLGLSKKETAQMIGAVIQNRFMPKLFSY